MSLTIERFYDGAQLTDGISVSQQEVNRTRFLSQYCLDRRVYVREYFDDQWYGFLHAPDIQGQGFSLLRRVASCIDTEYHLPRHPDDIRSDSRPSSKTIHHRDFTYSATVRQVLTRRAQAFLAPFSLDHFSADAVLAPFAELLQRRETSLHIPADAGLSDRFAFALGVFKHTPELRGVTFATQHPDQHRMREALHYLVAQYDRAELP